MIILVEALLVLALVAGLMWVLVGALQSRIGTAGKPTAPEQAVAPPQPDQELVEQARRAGEEDMRTAWLRWQLRPVPARAEHSDSSPITGTLAVAPKADWDVDRLRQHGRDVWAIRLDARLQGRHREVEARLDRVAAMVCDLVDEEFDTGLGQTSEQYLYHPQREVRVAYLAGGGRGVEAIMDTVAAARAQTRQDAATRAAAESLVQQRNAALKALRETRPPGGTRDAHAAWEAEAGQIDP